MSALARAEVESLCLECRLRVCKTRVCGSGISSSGSLRKAQALAVMRIPRDALPDSIVEPEGFQVISMTVMRGQGDTNELQCGAIGIPADLHRSSL